MQEFDTIKLSIPPEAVRHLNLDAFMIKPGRCDAGTGAALESQLWEAKKTALPVGVSGLTYKDESDSVYQLTYSAKVLGDEYLQGINRTNWSRGLDAIRPLLDADPYKVYDNSVVYRCDSTNNISVEDIGHPHSKVYASLLAGRANFRFKDIHYSSRRKQGIEFRGVQDEKNRLIAYSKHLDLLKNTNRDFIESLKNPAAMLRRSEKIIRFEVNHSSFKALRDRFGVGQNKLRDLLESTKPVNRDFLKKILSVKDVKQTALFDEYSQFSGKANDFIFMKGVGMIISELQYSDVAVKAFFRHLFPDESNFKYYWYNRQGGRGSIRAILESMQQKHFGVSASVSDNICNRILSLLAESVAA